MAPQLDAAALDEIATADYGAEVREHRRALTELVHSAWLPHELTWNPGEVLALTRWATPASRRDHRKRLFACMVLVRAVTAGGNPVDSLGPLVDSAWELGEPARGVTVRFLAWCRLNLPGDWRDDPSSAMFLTLSVLLLSAETAVSAALAAMLLEELDIVLTDSELPWRQRPGRRGHPDRRAPRIVHRRVNAGRHLVADAVESFDQVCDQHVESLVLRLGRLQGCSSRGEPATIRQERRRAFCCGAR